MTLELTKATHADLREQADKLNLGWMSDLDYDKGFIYFNTDVYEDSGWRYFTMKYSFTFEEGLLSVNKESGAEVTRDTDYTEVETSVKDDITSLTKMIKSLFTKQSEVKLLKQFDDKTHTVHEPLYMPYGKLDAHGDTYKNKEAMYQLVDNLEENKVDLQKAINHKCQTDCFDIVKAWVNEEAVEMDGVSISANQPMVTLKYTEKAFDLRKAGKLLGPSIGCSASGNKLLKSLQDLSMEQKAKRFVYDFDFSRKQDHLSLTTPSVGGPCSMEDWFVEVDLNKNFKDPDDIALLEELGEEFIALEKQKGVVGNEEGKAPSTSGKEAQDAGVDNQTLNKGKETNMSEEDKVELEALRKQVALGKAKEDLVKYKLSDEVVQGLAPLLATDATKVEIVKALDAMQSQLDSVQADNVELAKAVEDSGNGESDKEKTELEKAMGTEEGEASDESVEKEDLEVTLKKYREIEDK